MDIKSLMRQAQEVQKKIDEIMALDPNALASMMGEAQQAQQREVES